jgi:hypothetical protein
MPSRWISLTIVLFWLATTGYLGYKEFLPLLEPDVPPPFTIDLVDEAQHESSQIRWTVFLDGTPLAASKAVAKTEVVYKEKPDDSFTFLVDLNCVDPLTKAGLPLGNISLRSIRSNYRVNREAELLDVSADIWFDAAGIKNIEAHMDGKVVDGEFQSTCMLRQPDFGKLIEVPGKPIKITHCGSVLMPTHPVNRIKGLRKGQSWRQPLFNPLAEALSAKQLFGGTNETHYLRARVLPKAQLLPDHAEPIACLVIEYDDEEMQPRTWVQESTGLVMRQEATLLPGARLIMQRETISRNDQ